MKSDLFQHQRERMLVKENEKQAELFDNKKNHDYLNNNYQNHLMAEHKKTSDMNSKVYDNMSKFSNYIASVDPVTNPHHKHDYPNPNINFHKVKCYYNLIS